MSDDTKKDMILEEDNLLEMRKNVYAEHLALTQIIEKVAETVSLKLIAKGHICAKADIINFLVESIEKSRIEIKQDFISINEAIQDAAAENRHLLAEQTKDALAIEEKRKKAFDEHLKNIYAKYEDLSHRHNELKRLVTLYFKIAISGVTALACVLWAFFPKIQSGFFAVLEKLHKSW